MASGNRAAVYSRVYPADYSEDKAQRKAIEQHCQKSGLEVVGYYMDNGVKRGIPLGDTETGAQLLKDASAGAFDVVVYYDRDDVSIRRADQQRFEDQFQALGIEVRDLKIYLGTQRSSDLTIVFYGIDDPDRVEGAWAKVTRLLWSKMVRVAGERKEQEPAIDRNEPGMRDD